MFLTKLNASHFLRYFLTPSCYSPYYSSNQQDIKNKIKKTPFAKTSFKGRNEKDFEKNNFIIRSFKDKEQNQPTKITAAERKVVFHAYLFCNFPDEALKIFKVQQQLRESIHLQQYNNLLKCYLKLNYKR
eukprot:Pgem_evm1s13061